MSVLAGMVVLFLGSGCMQHSFPVDQQQVIRLAVDGPAGGGLTAREWLSETHEQLAGLLPQRERSAMLTEDLASADGTPRDVNEHFGTDPTAQHTLLANTPGLLHTAEATLDLPGEEIAPSWPGFEDIWIPVSNELSISARIGYAQNNGVMSRSDCVIMLPGILADKNVLRTRDICVALRDAGYHVVAIDLRGHGKTLRRFPREHYTFGLLETGDLLAVSEWLEHQPKIRHTALMGFCWGANLALLAAWEDGRGDDTSDVAPRLMEKMTPHSGRRHFQAGVIAFSPPLRYERILDQTAEREWSSLVNPVLAGLQDRIRDRFKLLGLAPICGNLRKLIMVEAAQSPYGTDAIVPEGLTYLRLLPYRNRPVSPKLEHARVPVLIVHAANDPLCPAQDVAEFIAPLKNSNVAAIVLPGGGHDGFAPYARDYFYSLIFNFYDPGLGAAANLARRTTPFAMSPASAAPSNTTPKPATQ